MYDENGWPAETLVMDWREHDDHADVGDEDPQPEFDWRHQLDAARAVTTATTCPACGREPGEGCVRTPDVTCGPVAGCVCLTLPHPARWHTARRGCGKMCDECWTGPDADGVRVQVGGADQSITVLWSDAATSTGSIRELGVTLVRDADAGHPDDRPLTIDALYVRDGRRLLPVNVQLIPAGDDVLVEVFTDREDWPRPIARAAYPAPAGWIADLERHGITPGNHRGRRQG